jgi:hypothetical protein
MASAIEALLPITVAAAALIFFWLEVSLSFTLHRMTDGSVVDGHEKLPGDGHEVARWRT